MKALLAGAAVVLVGMVAGGGVAAEDSRTVVKMPAEFRAEFMDEMRHHMDSFDDVLAQVAMGDFKAAAKVADEELVVGGGKGFGRYLPLEFREMGLAMHRSAAEFRDLAAAAPEKPTAADWQAVVSSLQVVSANCRACHASFRVE
ncbi:hypothetical protein [Rhodospirillum centenum]|uniref:Cytochrome c n=1 Tax=Rhodospirillum centenum (strain ATCC 51521 / SW) TaxID=414684 RepID=B6IXM4_RHOCS|nr:hypothetical protein [Rhodospirillum centenum]ACJ01048.1 conserved hypothetical protein [Rhodospirillum centenum SW]